MEHLTSDQLHRLRFRRRAVGASWLVVAVVVALLAV